MNNTTKEELKMLVIFLPEPVKKEIIYQAKKRGLKTDMYVLRALLSEIARSNYNGE